MHYTRLHPNDGKRNKTKCKYYKNGKCSFGFTSKKNRKASYALQIKYVDGVKICKSATYCSGYVETQKKKPPVKTITQHEKNKKNILNKGEEMALNVSRGDKVEHKEHGVGVITGIDVYVKFPFSTDERKYLFPEEFKEFFSVEEINEKLSLSVGTEITAKNNNKMKGVVSKIYLNIAFEHKTASYNYPQCFNDGFMKIVDKTTPILKPKQTFTATPPEPAIRPATIQSPAANNTLPQNPDVINVGQRFYCNTNAELLNTLLNKNYNGWFKACIANYNNDAIIWFPEINGKLHNGWKNYWSNGNIIEYYQGKGPHDFDYRLRYVFEKVHENFNTYFIYRGIFTLDENNSSISTKESIYVSQKIGSDTSYSELRKQDFSSWAKTGNFPLWWKNNTTERNN